MQALFSPRRWVGLVLLSGLVACSSSPEPVPPATPSVSDVPRAIHVVPQPLSDAPGDGRDAQGRRIAAHFAAPAGQGERVAQADAAGTYRVMLETLKDGSWRVQDFYQVSGNRFSAPFVVTEPADLVRQPAQSVEGWLRQYHHSGERLLVQMFRNGKAEGTASRYYADGKRQSVVIYRNNQPEGVGTFWHTNGATALKVTYRKGQAALFRGWNQSGERLPPDVAKAWYEWMTQRSN